MLPVVIEVSGATGKNEILMAIGQAFREIPLDHSMLLALSIEKKEDSVIVKIDHHSEIQTLVLAATMKRFSKNEITAEEATHMCINTAVTAYAMYGDRV